MKVKALINRNFNNYAISIITEPDKVSHSWDKSEGKVWMSKKDALKLVKRIREIFPPLHHD